MNALGTVTPIKASPFDSIRRVREDGAEYWTARDLMPLLGYDSYRRLTDAIDRAKATAMNQGLDAGNLFAGAVNKSSGGRPAEDVHLARFACYLVAMNGDPRKAEVAAAQAYFAIQTRVAETVPPAREMTGPELMARALLQADQTIKEQEKKVLELTPRAEAFDSFLSTAGDYSVNEAAKMLARDHKIHTGEKRLRAKLEEWGWVYRHCGVPRAKQAQVDNGRLAEKASFYFHPETGEKVAKEPQVRITPKGLKAIRDKWLEVAA